MKLKPWQWALLVLVVLVNLAGIIVTGYATANIYTPQFQKLRGAADIINSFGWLGAWLFIFFMICRQKIDDKRQESASEKLIKVHKRI